MKTHLRWLPAAAAVAWLASALWPVEDRAGEMRLQEIARVPVVHQGRCKPLDTLARTSLMILSDRQTFVDEDGNRRPAIRWLLDVFTSSLHEHSPAEKHKVFRIENDQVRSQLGLEERPGFRYALDEFSGRIEEIQRQASRAQALPPEQRDLVAAKFLQLFSQVELYVTLAQFEAPHFIPPSSPGAPWRTVEEASKGGSPEPALDALARILHAWSTGETKTFNDELAKYRRLLDARVPGTERAASDFEVLFNRVEPFYQCSILYLAVLLLACGAWLGWARELNSGAFRLLLVALGVHTCALGARMLLQGRPPVTNLYSSAIFIGWACLVLAIVLEGIYRNGIGTILGATIGFLTQLVAHNLAGSGDTLEMMQAVLDTNFWLATHVTAVTIGYSATFMAGFLGILFVVRGVGTRSLDPETSRSLGGMIYGVLCFATLLSFTGTVLGGIWADQSWGRFWGWDTKENGALMIVLWNALALHARWGGLVRARGLALLAIFGNIVTAWSWFGVNMLGVGLHSYGFMESAVFWLALFAVAQVALIGLGLLPARLWRSRNPAELQPVAGAAH